MKIGARRVFEELEKVHEVISERKNELVAVISEFENRVEAFHRNALVISIESHPFAVIHAISPDGMSLTAQVLTDPFRISPSPFKFELSFEGLHVKMAGLMEFPPKTRFLSLIGDERWVEKISVYERVKGVEFLSFAFRVDDNLHSYLERLKTENIEGAILELDDEGLNVIVVVPGDISHERTQLLAEMAKVIRDELDLEPARFSKIPRGIRAIATFRLGFEKVVGDEDALKVVNDFVERLKRGYDMFLKGAGLS